MGMNVARAQGFRTAYYKSIRDNRLIIYIMDNFVLE